MRRQSGDLGRAGVGYAPLGKLREPVVVEAGGLTDGRPLTAPRVELCLDGVDGAHMAGILVSNYQLVKHQITRRLPDIGRMLPVAKILADNVTRLIDRLPDRQPRPQLAARMGIGDKTLGFIRAGTGNPTLENIAKVAKFLKVKPWELLRSDGDQSQSQAGRFDDETMAQALELLYLMAAARPDDTRLRRPSWATILLAAKAVSVAEGSQREAMAQFLEGLATEA